MNLETDVTDLGNRLKSDDMSERHAALIEIRKRRFSVEEAEYLLGLAIELLEDPIPYVRQAVPKTVVSLADDHAGALGPRVSDHVSKLTPLLDDDDREIRAGIAALLGATGTESAIRELDSRYDSEVGSVADGIERGLRSGCRNIIESLLESDYDENDSMVQGLLLLARRHPELVIDDESRLFDMLDGPNGDIIGEVFIELMRTESKTELSVSTLREAISIEEDADDERVTAAINAIDAVTRGRFDETTISEDVDRFAGWLKADRPKTRRRSIRLLTPVAKNSPAFLDDHIDTLTSRVVSEDAELGGEAKQLLLRYAESRVDSPIGYLKVLLGSTGGLPAFEWLSDQLDVLRYETENEWITPNGGNLGEGLITGLHRAYRDERTAPVFWPTYEPRVTVTAAVATLLEGLPAGRDTVLYTSGSPNHWGGKGDVRAEYERYGLDVPSDIAESPIDGYHRFNELLPTAYVSKGTRKTYGDRPGPVSLVLVSRDEELADVDTVGPTLFDFHAQVDDEEEELVDAVIEADSDRLICPMYSLYTKQEHDGNRVPEYGPPNIESTVKIPDTRTLLDTLEGESTSERPVAGFPTDADDVFRRLATSREIRVTPVDATSIRDALSEGYDAVNFLLDNGAAHAGWRSFSYLQRFERLSVPVESYDEWVRDKRRRGKRGRNSWMMTEFIEEFGNYSINTEGIARPGTSDVHEELADISEALAIENPLFESVCSTVADAIDDGQRVAVFAPKPTLRKVLQEELLQAGVITKSDLRHGHVSIVDRDSARSLKDCDHLVIPGPQARRYAGFHIHPIPDQVTVLTYDGRWVRMTERRVNRWVDRLNEVLQQADAEPVPHATVTLEEPDQLDSLVADTARLAKQEGSGNVVETTEPTTADSSVESFEERIAASLDDSGFGDTYTYEKDRYEEYEQQRFAIETQSGETLYRDAGNRVLVEDYVLEDLSKLTRYKWVSPSELPTDATILVVDSAVWNDIWDEWLDEQYDDIDGGGVTDYLAQWHDTLTEILEEAATGSESPESSIVIERVVDRLKDAGIERSQARIRAWFRSVVDADVPLDLARDPSLTMAPRNPEDIDIIGHEFSKPALQGEQARLITAARDKIHGAHIREGHEFREEIIKDLESDGELGTRILEGSHRYQVRAIKDITD